MSFLSSKRAGGDINEISTEISKALNGLNKSICRLMEKKPDPNLQQAFDLMTNLDNKILDVTHSTAQTLQRG
jgi:hypothetical protein